VGLSLGALPWPQGIRSSGRWRASQHLSHGIRTVTPYRMACPGSPGQRLGPEIWPIFQGITAVRQSATPFSLVSTAASFDHCWDFTCVTYLWLGRTISQICEFNIYFRISNRAAQKVSFVQLYILLSFHFTTNDTMYITTFVYVSCIVQAFKMLPFCHPLKAAEV